MSDSEVVKTFKRCCGGSANACAGCPYRQGQRCKIKQLHRDVLALVERLQKENKKLLERLEGKND